MADQNLAARGSAFEPRSDIHGVAHHGVTHPQVIADIPCNHCARVDADMQTQGLLQFINPSPVKCFEALSHRQAGAQRPFRVIFQRNRRPKNCHHAITNEFVDHTLVLVNRCGQFLTATVREGGDLLRIQTF